MQLPDGPQAPSLMQTIQMFLNPSEHLEAAAKQYGNCFTIRLVGSSPLVIFSNPQAIQEILNAEPNQFKSAEASKMLLPFLGSNSLSVNDGNYHQQQRRLLKPAFHGKRMWDYSAIIHDTTIAVMDEWAIGDPKPVKLFMQEILMRVIMQTIFSINSNSRFQRLKKLLREMFNFFDSPLASSMLFFPFLQKNFGSWGLWGRFLNLRQQIDELIYTEIEERRAKEKEISLQSSNDILSLMMSAHDEYGQRMTDKQLRDEAMTLIFSSHESTATILSWSLYWIHYLPEVKDRLLQELRDIISEPEPTEIFQLPYLTAVISEVLRMYPTSLFTVPRITQSPIQLMGYTLDENTAIAPCIYLTHHRPDLYPEPKCFRPERFLECQFSPYEYFPFGGGNRGCIGMVFAQFTIKLVIVTLLTRYQLALADKQPEKYVYRGITLGPSTGVKMVKV